MKTYIYRSLAILLMTVTVFTNASAYQFNKIYEKVTGNKAYSTRVDKKDKNGTVIKATFTDETYKTEISENKEGTGYNYHRQSLANPEYVQTGTFDKIGRLTESKTLYKGKPAENARGYCSKTINYKSNQVVERLYDIKGKPITGYDGYSIKVIDIDSPTVDIQFFLKKNAQAELPYTCKLSYYDQDSIPVTVDGWHNMQVIVDHKGIRIAYRGIDGKRVPCKNGYSDITCRPIWKNISVDNEFIDMDDEEAYRFDPAVYLLFTDIEVKYHLIKCDSKGDDDLLLINSMLSAPLIVYRAYDSSSDRVCGKEYAVKRILSRMRINHPDLYAKYYQNVISSDLYDNLQGWDVIYYSKDRAPVNVDGVACITLVPDLDNYKYRVADRFDASGKRLVDER